VTMRTPALAMASRNSARVRNKAPHPARATSGRVHAAGAPPLPDASTHSSRHVAGRPIAEPAPPPVSERIMPKLLQRASPALSARHDGASQIRGGVAQRRRRREANTLAQTRKLTNPPRPSKVGPGAWRVPTERPCEGQGAERGSAHSPL
jgi:hypothetical protein